MLCTQFSSMLTRAHICCITSFEFLLFQTFSDSCLSLDCLKNVAQAQPSNFLCLYCPSMFPNCLSSPSKKLAQLVFCQTVQTSLIRAVLGAPSNSSSDASEHSEESDIRSLTDSKQYLACSESTTPITLSTL